MITVLSMVLAAAAFALVAYPFFKRSPAAMLAGEEDKLRELGSHRDTTYSMIKELDFDYQSGVLAEEDYQELQARYKKKAVEILKEIDGVRGESLEEEVERQVSVLRGVQRPARAAEPPAAGAPAAAQPAGNAAPETPAAAVPKRAVTAQTGKNVFCTQCGAKIGAGDRFCAACGTALKGARNAR